MSSTSREKLTIFGFPSIELSNFLLIFVPLGSGNLRDVPVHPIGSGGGRWSVL